MKKNFSILILNDGKAGHLNQSKAVAEMVRKRKIDQGLSEDEIETRTVEVKFKNRVCRMLLSVCAIFSIPRCRRCLGCLRFCLDKGCLNELMQSPANIIVSCGSSLSAVNLFLSYKNSARSLVLMKPSFLSLNKFDLVIAPEHDRIKQTGNVLLTKIAPNLIDRRYLEQQAKILDARYKIDGPNIGVLIGGNTRTYRFTKQIMQKVIFQLKEAARRLNCRILVTTSRRTPKAAEALLKENLVDFPGCKLLVIANEKNIPGAVGGILGLSDIVVVSGESISMVSEAASAEKHVLVFMPESKVGRETKQERFLGKLAQARLLKVVPADNLLLEIDKIYREKPEITKLDDRERIYQALDRIV